jgi:prolyl oligopeptidase
MFSHVSSGCRPGFRILAVGLVAVMAAAEFAHGADEADRWLEEVEGAAALEWVGRQNARTLATLDSPEFERLEAEVLAILDSETRIPAVVEAGGRLYNFWKDREHPRGIWRRTTLAEYRQQEPEWELLLDLDALSAAEDENWVWGGAKILRPGCERALLSLSRGGADAKVVREFDLPSRRFVDDGFGVAESKGSVSWIDRDTIFVAADFGPGTMTTSGYPRTARRWRRDTPLTAAEVVFEGRPDDMAVSAVHDDAPGFERDYVRRVRSFYDDELFLLLPEGTLRKIDLPDTAEKWVFHDLVAIELRQPWTRGGTTHPAGSLLLGPLESLLAPADPAVDLAVAFEPDDHTALAGVTFTRGTLVLTTLEDVKNRLTVFDLAGCFDKSPAEQVTLLRARLASPQRLDDTGEIGTRSASAIDADRSDELFLTTTGFLTPTTLWYCEDPRGSEPLEPLKRLPAFFDAAGLDARQLFATSADGTRVPYFVIGPAGSADQPRPAVLYAYGGFEIPLLPRYDAVAGKAWLEQGGVFVVANIRGGGEYGPRWHQAAIKANRPRAYEDCAAVAGDLVARGITTPRQLGVMGGSNGGLLVGNMVTRHPECFAAAVCQVPLLDMRRYTKLLAGASWIDEYGDPDDPQEWDFLRTFSPYHAVVESGRYPPMLLLTSTRDDRVHPGHARKMMAKMSRQGHEVWYYENTEGGHAAAATNRQAARMRALAWRFLGRELGLAGSIRGGD